MKKKQVSAGCLIATMLLPPLMACAGSLSGTVTDESGQAIAGAQVTLQSVMGFAVVQLGVTSTDASGHYQFDDVRGALYASAYLDELHTTGLPGGGVCIAPNGCWNDVANQYYVGDGDAMTLDAIVLRPAGALDIRPLLGSSTANIHYRLDVSNEIHAPHTFGLDGQGELRVSHLPAGDYAVKLVPQDTQYLGQCGDDSAFDALVATPCLGSHEVHVQPGVVRSVPLHLQKGVRFSGRVTDGHTGEAADVLVEIVDADHPDSSATGYNQTSGFLIGPLLPRSYVAKFVGGVRYKGELFDDVPCADDTCVLTGAAVFTPQAGAHVAHVDAMIEPRQWISGEVIDQDTLQPLAGITVKLMHAEPMVFSGGWTWSTDKTTTSDAQGKFQISGVVPGGFTLRAEDPNNHYIGLQMPALDCGFSNRFCDDAPVAEQDNQWQAPYHLNPDQPVSGLSLVMHPGATVSGTVTNSVTGGPLSGAYVELVNATDTGSNLMVVTDAAGRYTSRAFNAVTVKVSANNNVADQLYPGLDCVAGFSCDYSAGTPIPVSANQHVSGIDFSLPPDGNTLFSSGFELP